MIDLRGYSLTFDDEFNQRSISQNGTNTTWADIRSGSRMSPNADIGFGNSAFVDPSSGIDPFNVANGALTITARRADHSITGPGDWASGLIHTQQSFSQLYGYFEMRADLPADKGVWSAFWMLRENNVWPPEVDVLEGYGTNTLWQYVHSNAGGTYNQQQIQTEHPTMLTGYHTYGVLWQPDYMSFYYDGEYVGRATTPADLHSPMYLLADLAIQRGIAGTTDAPKSLSIDYIRAYSNAPGVTAVALDHVSSPDGADTDGLYGASAAGTGGTGGTGGGGTGGGGTGGTGGDGTLSLRVSSDHYQGGAQFAVFVDGHQAGGIQTVAAHKVLGQWQDVSVTGNFNPDTVRDVEVRFLNDAWDGAGGGEGHDRNLYVQQLKIDGQSFDWTKATGNVAPWSTGSAAVASNGGIHFAVSAGGSPDPGQPNPPVTPTPPVPTPPVPTPGGDGSVTVRVSSDRYMGAAEFQLLVDGVTVGSVKKADAVHVLGQWNDLTFAGNFDASKVNTVEVRFLNDAWDGIGGGEGHDRNLYVQNVSVDGHTVDWTHATGNVAPWSSGSAAIASNGSILFHVDHGLF